MKFFWLKALPLLLCLLIVGGCISKVKLGNVHVEIIACHTAQTPDQAELTLRYVNENIFPLAISETEAKLSVNGEYLGKVEQNNPVGIPSLSSVTRPALLRIEKPEVLQKVLAGPTPTVAYVLNTTMGLNLSEDREKIRSKHNGQLETNGLRAAPQTEAPR